jgi:polysaccharide pyruvyl transferase WcaK-like protein
MIYHVFANRSNVGDWLSARGVQLLLAPLTVQELLCDEPFVESTLQTLSQATAQDFILIGGGGLFMNYFVSFWRGFLEVAKTVPFCLWGIGYCDMKLEQTLPPLDLVEAVVRRSQLCVVRDELTRQHLRSCALPAPVPCPTVMAVPTARAGAGHQLLHVDHYDNVGVEMYEAMVRTAQEFAQRTGRSYRQTNNRIPAGDVSALQRTLDLYASADLILTSRLHGCIIALATGRKVLVVSADHKIESFMDAAGLSKWVCDLDEIDTLPQRLQSLSNEVVPPLHFVEQARGQNRAVADQIRALIRGANSW